MRASAVTFSLFISLFGGAQAQDSFCAALLAAQKSAESNFEGNVGELLKESEKEVRRATKLTLGPSFDCHIYALGPAKTQFSLYCRQFIKTSLSGKAPVTEESNKFVRERADSEVMKISECLKIPMNAREPWSTQNVERRSWGWSTDTSIRASVSLLVVSPKVGVSSDFLGGPYMAVAVSSPSR